MWRVEWKGRWGRWVWEDETSAFSSPAVPLVPPGPEIPRPNCAEHRRGRRRRRSEAEEQALIDLARCAMDPGEVETIAEKAVTDAEMGHLWFPLAELLAIRLGYFVRAEPALAGCGHEGLWPNVLLVRATRDEHRWTLRLLHELAHALLRAGRRRFRHGDVWALTLALAVPRRSVRHLDAARHIPRWAVILRRRTARAVPWG